MTYTSNSNTQIIKFLYSYGGTILPRRSDDRLRYVGGLTRILSVHRSITFTELMIKFGESCGESMSLRCKLPSEDLDVLVSIKSHEDLKNVIEEYDRFSSSTNQEVKVRAILSPINSQKKIVSPPSSPMSCFDFPYVPRNSKPPVITSGGRGGGGSHYSSPPFTAAHRCCAPVVGYPVRGVRRETAKINGSVSRHHHHHNVYLDPQWYYYQK